MDQNKATFYFGPISIALDSTQAWKRGDAVHRVRDKAGVHQSGKWSHR